MKNLEEIDYEEWLGGADIMAVAYCSIVYHYDKKYSYNHKVDENRKPATEMIDDIKSGEVLKIQGVGSKTYKQLLNKVNGIKEPEEKTMEDLGYGLYKLTFRMAYDDLIWVYYCDGTWEKAFKLAKKIEWLEGEENKFNTHGEMYLEKIEELTSFNFIPTEEVL